MIRALAAAMLLSGCCTAPKERIVYVAKPVHTQTPAPAAEKIDPALLRDCDKPAPSERSASEYADTMRKLQAAIDECNSRLRKARGGVK